MNHTTSNPNCHTRDYRFSLVAGKECLEPFIPHLTPYFTFSVPVCALPHFILKLPSILLALPFLPIYKQPLETKMDDSSSMSDTESAFSHVDNPGSPFIQSLAVLPTNEAPGNSKRTSK